VLLAAACHAGWNATIKRGLDPLATTVLISIGAAVVSGLALPFVGMPAMAAWPWCAASVLIHLFYFAALIESYRAGDMGQVYPIARGSAPLMTPLRRPCSSASGFGLVGWCGISLLVAGVCRCRCARPRSGKLDRRAVGFALFTAVTICAYSVVDGVGQGAGSAQAISGPVRWHRPIMALMRWCGAATR
jgi:hypothetical protein